MLLTQKGAHAICSCLTAMFLRAWGEWKYGEQSIPFFSTIWFPTPSQFAPRTHLHFELHKVFRNRLSLSAAYDNMHTSQYLASMNSLSYERHPCPRVIYSFADWCPWGIKVGDDWHRNDGAGRSKHPSARLAFWMYRNLIYRDITCLIYRDISTFSI